MNDFTYYNPVRLVFGRGAIGSLGKLIGPGERVLLVYGGGSIKRNGVHQQVCSALKTHRVHEFGGITPNPRYEDCLRAVDRIRRDGIDFLLAVGGGSVLDAVKFIAAAACYRGKDPWDMVTKARPPKKALPLGCVLTLPATGSEMNPNAVISHAGRGEKRALIAECLHPRFSILDPETTYSLPYRQTANGIVDAFVHVVEQSMTYPVSTPLQDRQAEAILRTLIEEGRRVRGAPRDYDVRANLMWCATNALNRWIGCGTVQDWSTHQIGHELTALYGIDHARSLAVVLPALWRHERQRKAEKLRLYAQRVWDVKATDPDAVETAIRCTEAFFHELEVPTRLADYGIDAAAAAQAVAGRLAARKFAGGEHGLIDAQAVREIVGSA